jgi:hypothetical protein
MTDSTIAHTGGDAATGPTWMPFPELAEPLAQLDAERAAFDTTVQRVISETAATIQALMDETAAAVKEVLDAATVTAELDDEQTARVLRRVRQRAGRRPVGFQPPQVPR